MNYLYLLIICLFMMVSIALIMYYLGTKISYNYILYNASVSVGSGVIFFLVKMILTIELVGPVEQMLDIVISLLLIIVWLVTLVETLTVEIMENRQEIKQILRSLVNKIKPLVIRLLPSWSLLKRCHEIYIKAKNNLVNNKLTIRIQKIIAEFIK